MPGWLGGLAPLSNTSILGGLSCCRGRRMPEGESSFVLSVPVKSLTPGRGFPAAAEAGAMGLGGNFPDRGVDIRQWTQYSHKAVWEVRQGARCRGLANAQLPVARCRLRLCHCERYWHGRIQAASQHFPKLYTPSPSPSCPSRGCRSDVRCRISQTRRRPGCLQR